MLTGVWVTMAVDRVTVDEALMQRVRLKPLDRSDRQPHYRQVKQAIIDLAKLLAPDLTLVTDTAASASTAPKRPAVVLVMREKRLVGPAGLEPATSRS